MSVLPSLPLPEPLRGSDADTFTERTMTVRVPDIGRRVLAENAFAPEIVARLEQLVHEVPYGKIRPLSDPAAPDLTAWQAHIEPYIGQNWLTVPWFFAETYFFRRIIEAIDYFGDGSGAGADPFAYQKRLGLETSLGAIRSLAQFESRWLGEAGRLDVLQQLLSADLWGNQADMGLWAPDDESQPRHTDETTRDAHLLVDDRTAVSQHLLDHAGHVIFVVDNAGLELIGDLVLADYLLQTGTAVSVTLHLKIHPTFVSDATIANVQETIRFLQEDSDSATRALGKRLAQLVENGSFDKLSTARLQLTAHPFWTSPLPWWELPAYLKAELSAAHLVISKGDANYRRLAGDRHWPHTTPFADVMSYQPSPLLALRTHKSEVAIGLSPAQIAWLNQHHPEWLTNGEWGVIQFYFRD
ncbi:MAG: damage-control phosphatase ARMT1 family protein [Chloroflexota bacterium]